MSLEPELFMDPNNFDKLRSYIPQHYPGGEAYTQGEAMADLTTWATDVELSACAQLCGKILCATVIGDGSGTLLVETPGNQQEVHSSLQTKMVTTLTL